MEAPIRPTEGMLIETTIELRHHVCPYCKKQFSNPVLNGVEREHVISCRTFKFADMEVTVHADFGLMRQFLFLPHEDQRNEALRLLRNSYNEELNAEFTRRKIVERGFDTFVHGGMDWGDKRRG